MLDRDRRDATPVLARDAQWCGWRTGLASELAAPRYGPGPEGWTARADDLTGAAWIVPKHYVEQVGDEGFKRHPIGLGPYRLVEHQPGIEVVLEAYPEYWRKTPAVQRLVMLKRQEADVAYGMYGAVAEEIRRDATLTLQPTVPPTPQWMTFTSALYDPRSPWADKRVRLAANHALNRQAINEAETLGHSLLKGSIIPRSFDYALPLEPSPVKVSLH